ncbi:universal stress protein [Pontibacter locisalis]|uniref:Universal stress protein n=1 Tax=Pontibacter locisalis TaxID=1719035 RepID=A0ABW5IGG8_9BACT
MKNILLSIDFSEYAEQVALFTAELAQQAQARLILFYAYNPTPPANGEEDNQSISERWAQARLDRLAGKIRKETTVSVTRLLKPGNLQDVTYEVTSKVKADIIILCQDEALNLPTLLLDSPLSLRYTHPNNTPTITMSSTNNPNPDSIKPALAELLNLKGYDTSPLLDAV